MTTKTTPLDEHQHNLKWINWVCLGLNTENGKEEPLFIPSFKVKTAVQNSLWDLAEINAYSEGCLTLNDVIKTLTKWLGKSFVETSKEVKDDN